MSGIKKLICVLLSLLFIISLGACSDTKDAYLYFELPETPTTLDPQVASTDAELLIVRNVFEGLLRKNEKGEIVCGAAESYTKNGLTYTFKLKEDLKWSNEEKLTAKDFEFGLRRAVSPKTNAPFVTRLLNIKNAKQVNNGGLSTDSLGVKAIDDTTLEITLEKEDDLFLETLTTSVSMPCNEKFFYETEGKYGIFAESLLSNGSYKLSRWRKESFGIRLYRNTYYNGDFESKNAAVFITCNKDKDTLEQLSKNSIDIAFIDCTLQSSAKEQGLNTTSLQNICWVMTLGKNFTKDMRKAFSLLIGSEVFAGKLAEGYSAANSLFPEAITKNSSATGVTVYDKETAKQIYVKELDKLPDNKFPTDALLYFYDNGAVKPVINDIVGHWQNNLSAFINIEVASSAELLLPQLTDNSYCFAVFPVVADSNRTDEYLKKFGITNFDGSLSDIERKILKDNEVTPIMFQNTVIASSRVIKNLNASVGNGYIDFAYIVKE